MYIVCEMVTVRPTYTMHFAPLTALSKEEPFSTVHGRRPSESIRSTQVSVFPEIEIIPRDVFSAMGLKLDEKHNRAL